MASWRMDSNAQGPAAMERIGIRVPLTDGVSLDIAPVVASDSDRAMAFARVLEIELAHDVTRALGAAGIESGKRALGRDGFRLNVAVHEHATGTQVTFALSTAPRDRRERALLWSDRMCLSDGNEVADRALLGARSARGITLALRAALCTSDGGADAALRAWAQLWMRPQTAGTNVAALQLLDASPDSARTAVGCSARAYARFRAGNLGWHGVDPVPTLHAALADATHAIDIRPDYPEAHFAYGMVALALDDHTVAQASLLEALAQDPAFAPAQGNLGFVWLMDGDLVRARGALDRAQAISPHEPMRAVWYATRSFVHLLGGDVCAARADAANAVCANPRHRFGWLACTLANALDGRRDQALQALQKLEGLRTQDRRFPDPLHAPNLKGDAFMEMASPIFERTRALLLPPRRRVGQLPAAPLMIRCLGTFTIEREGRALLWGRKLPRKPLELIKVLVALGGASVPVDDVVEALWPDAQGERARRRLDTTLWRVRRLLGEEAAAPAIRYEVGLLSFDPAAVQVDALAFRTSDNPDLYAGEFLPGDTASRWSVAMREALRERHGSLLASAAERALARGDLAHALASCERGIAADPLAERLYQIAMQVCAQAGWRAEGAMLYQRLRRSLAAALGVKPAPQTEGLHLRLIRN
ncbi:MAG: hypothetical protein H7125_02065 [Proteobacteria bacterium]|nr:hypothetical protein [Burkholderiales bacterium]